MGFENLRCVGASKELNFLLYLILIFLNFNSHMWLVVTILDISKG